MCKKGWNAADLFAAPDRLTTAYIRTTKKSPLRPVSPDVALDFVAKRIGELQERRGRDSVGLFGGGGLTNETAYSLGKFARAVLRTKNIDYNGRYCMASAAVALQKSFGVDRGIPFPLSDLVHAKLIVLVGANPAATMPPLMQYFDEQKAAGGKLIVIDPRRTKTAEYADLHLPLTPGTDIALANGLLHILARDRKIDEKFIENHTNGFAAVRRAIGQYWPDRVERLTGLAIADLEKASQMLGAAETVTVLTARGPEQQSHGVQNVTAFINLTLALGQFGRRGSGFGCITGQGNGQGGREHGQKSDQLPGYRSLRDADGRKFVADIWGIEESDLPGPGTSATEMLEDLGKLGGLSALLVFGSNLLVSSPNAVQVKKALQRLDLLVVADAFLSETAEVADVVFPICHWAEHDGTMTNLEGRLLRRRKAVDPPSQVLTDLEVLHGLASRLGKGQLISADPAEVFEELCRASAGGVADYSAMSYQRLDAEEELFWPCSTSQYEGTPRPFENGFSTDDKKAFFSETQFVESAEQVSDAYPFYLTTGRLLSQYQTGTQTRRVRVLNEAEPEPFAHIHPGLAATLKLAEGEWVALSTRRGKAIFRVKLSTAERLDTVFVPFHWGGTSSINLLTSGLIDPSSKIPEFKRCAVSLARVAVQKTPTSPDQTFDS